MLNEKDGVVLCHLFLWKTLPIQETLCYNLCETSVAATTKEGSDMENIYVQEKTFDEFSKRVQEQEERQNERLDGLEKNYGLINKLYVSVERLAINMETMTRELARQSDCLKELESKPAKRWDAVVSSIISGIIGLVIGLVTVHFQ